jgi:hypothetical protein
LSLWGTEKVTAAGFATLGIPAILATADYEFRAIREKLNPPPKP